VGVDPDEVADGRKLEDTSSGCQSECRAADLCPWKGVLPSGHRNLEPFDKNNRVVRIPCVAFQWCNQSRRSTSLKATVQRSDAYFHAKPLAEKRHFLPIISAPKHTPNIMYLSMVGTYPSPVVAKRASGNGSREEVVLAVAGACPPGADGCHEGLCSFARRFGRCRHALRHR
jgi:hypothetical protein